jgi:hypothetical protein
MAVEDTQAYYNLAKKYCHNKFYSTGPCSWVHDKQEIYYEPDACNRQGTGLGSACLPTQTNGRESTVNRVLDGSIYPG